MDFRTDYNTDVDGCGSVFERSATESPTMDRRCTGWYLDSDGKQRLL
jgi:hypothetical protein